MRKTEFVLTKTENEVKAIEFTEQEEYVLIHLEKYPANAIINVMLIDAKGQTERNPNYGQEFIRLKRSHYDKLILGKGSQGEEEIRGVVYAGTWIEILLFDINQNLESLSIYTEDTDGLYFVIGEKQSTHLTVTDALDGVYRLKRVLVIPPTSSFQRTDITVKSTYLGKMVELIHEKIKSNVALGGFIEIQSKDKRKASLTHNFLLHY